MENIRVAKEKIDLLLDIFGDNLIKGSLLNNKTSNLTAVDGFDFLQVRTIIKEVETGLNVL